MNNTIKLAIVVTAGVVALAVIFTLYQGLVALPKQELKQVEQERSDGIESSINQSILLDTCLREAERSYWDWVELNMEEQDDGSFIGSEYNWTLADTNKSDDEDACYRQYTE